MPRRGALSLVPVIVARSTRCRLMAQRDRLQARRLDDAESDENLANNSEQSGLHATSSGHEQGTLAADNSHR